MTAQELINKYPILIPAWSIKSKDGTLYTTTGALKTTGPVDPWNQRFTLMGCKVERDGLTNEVMAWYPLTIINGNGVTLTLINDPTDLTE